MNAGTGIEHPGAGLVGSPPSNGLTNVSSSGIKVPCRDRSIQASERDFDGACTGRGTDLYAHSYTQSLPGLKKYLQTAWAGQGSNLRPWD
jgi:hypothetical protein